MISWNVPPCRISQVVRPFFPLFFFFFFVDVTFDGESAKEVRTWEPKHKERERESLEDPLLLKRNNIPMPDKKDEEGKWI